MLDAPNAEYGLHRYCRSAFTERISDELIEAVVDGASGFTSPLSALIFFYMHGAATRPLTTETAFAARRAQRDFDAIGQWSDAATSDQHIAGCGRSGPVASLTYWARPTSTTWLPMIARRPFGPLSARTTRVFDRSRPWTT
jgi:hypothetical protein